MNEALHLLIVGPDDPVISHVAERVGNGTPEIAARDRIGLGEGRKCRTQEAGIKPENLDILSSN